MFGCASKVLLDSRTDLARSVTERASVALALVYVVGRMRTSRFDEASATLGRNIRNTLDIAAKGLPIGRLVRRLRARGAWGLVCGHGDTPRHELKRTGSCDG